MGQDYPWLRNPVFLPVASDLVTVLLRAQHAYDRFHQPFAPSHSSSDYDKLQTVPCVRLIATSVRMRCLPILHQLHNQRLRAQSTHRYERACEVLDLHIPCRPQQRQHHALSPRRHARPLVRRHGP